MEMVCYIVSYIYVGMLSPGELQRLAFARVLFHRPQLAVMDEPVSAVGTSVGRNLMQLLQCAKIAAIVTGQADSSLINDCVSNNLFTCVVTL